MQSQVWIQETPSPNQFTQCCLHMLPWQEEAWRELWYMGDKVFPGMHPSSGPRVTHFILSILGQLPCLPPLSRADCWKGEFPLSLLKNLLSTYCVPGSGPTKSRSIIYLSSTVHSSSLQWFRVKNNVKLNCWVPLSGLLLASYIYIGSCLTPWVSISHQQN